MPTVQLTMRVTNKGATWNDIVGSLILSNMTAGKAIETIGENAREYMVNIILVSKKSKNFVSYTPTLTGNSLEESIRVHREELPDGTLIGVGEIVTMNREAPYWAAVNWGASYMLPEIRPKTKKALKFSERLGFPFPNEGDSVFASRVRSRQQTISPMNYIDKTRQWLDYSWQIIFDNLMTKLVPR